MAENRRLSLWQFLADAKPVKISITDHGNLQDALILQASEGH